MAFSFMVLCLIAAMLGLLMGNQWRKYEPFYQMRNAMEPESVSLNEGESIVVKTVNNYFFVSIRHSSVNGYSSPELRATTFKYTGQEGKSYLWSKMDNQFLHFYEAIELDGLDLAVFPTAAGMEEIPSEGTNAVYLAKFGTNLFFRIFDTNGDMVFNKGQSELHARGDDVSFLSEKIGNLEILRDGPEANGPANMRRYVADKIASIAGHRPVERHLLVARPAEDAESLFSVRAPYGDVDVGIAKVNAVEPGNINPENFSYIHNSPVNERILMNELNKIVPDCSE